MPCMCHVSVYVSFLACNISLWVCTATRHKHTLKTCTRGTNSLHTYTQTDAHTHTRAHIHARHMVVFPNVSCGVPQHGMRWGFSLPWNRWAHLSQLIKSIVISWWTESGLLVLGETTFMQICWSLGEWPQTRTHMAVSPQWCVGKVEFVKCLKCCICLVPVCNFCGCVYILF